MSEVGVPGFGWGDDWRTGTDLPENHLGLGFRGLGFIGV